MIYTTRIKNAIKFATKTHEVYQKQKRKGKDVAYITHPLTVGLILCLAGASENVIVAGILHDTIEDSIPGKKVTIDLLTERFGQQVAALVVSVSELDKSLPWAERKQQAIQHIATFSHDSLLLKSADLISNYSELIDDYHRYGDQAFESFNAPKKQKLQNIIAAIEMILRRWQENPLREDLEQVKKGLEDIE